MIHSDDRELREADEYPVLPVRDVVVFPRLLTPLFVGRDQSIRAIEAAQAADSRLVVAVQRDANLDNPAPEDRGAHAGRVGLVREDRPARS